MIRKYSELSGRRVRYYEAGKGEVVVFLHGAGATGRLWRKQMGPLSELFRVLAPDLPGFGGTDTFQEIKDVKGYAGFLAAFLENTGISRVSLVGSSMGGWAACWFALVYPEKIDKLVLVSPAGVYLSEDPPMPVQRLLEEIKLLYGAAGSGQDKGAAGELEKGLSTVKHLYEGGGMKPDLAGMLSMIKPETLVIWGDEDKVIPLSYSGIFGAGIKNAMVDIIKGAGHLPYADKPDIFNKTVSDFLKEAA